MNIFICIISIFIGTITALMTWIWFNNIQIRPYNYVRFHIILILIELKNRLMKW